MTFKPKACFVIISLIEDVLMLSCINKDYSCHSCLKDSKIVVSCGFKGQKSICNNSTCYQIFFSEMGSVVVPVADAGGGATRSLTPAEI